MHPAADHGLRRRRVALSDSARFRATTISAWIETHAPTSGAARGDHSPLAFANDRAEILGSARLDRAQPRQGDVLVQLKSASAPVLTPGRPHAVTASGGFLQSRPDRAEWRDGRRASDAHGSSLPEVTGEPRTSSMSSHRAMTLTTLRPMPLANAPPTRRVCAPTGVKSARFESGVLAVVMGEAPLPQWEVAANRGEDPHESS